MFKRMLAWILICALATTGTALDTALGAAGVSGSVRNSYALPAGYMYPDMEELAEMEDLLDSVGKIIGKAGDALFPSALAEEKSVSSEEDFTVSADGVLIEYTGSAQIVEIPSSVSDIAAKVFEGRTEIESVVLPAGLKRISSYAFNGCSGLTEIGLPDGLESIEDYAFNSTALTELMLPDSVTSFSTSVLPSGLKKIGGRRGFRRCLRVRSVATAASRR